MAITTNEWQGILTNSCTCEVYDEETDTHELSQVCFGDCWDGVLHLLAIDLGDWFTDNEEGWWQVSGLPLWNRSVSGVFQATTIADFVRGITVDAEWTLRYRLHGETLIASLSHHDVPMGRQFTVTYGTNPDYDD
jgi:hypothetical protein